MFETWISGILLAYGVFMIGMFTPGPNVLAVIGTSMSTGRRQGRALALGIGTGSVCWGFLTLVGLTALISAYASFIVVLKIVGAAYLFWMAIKAFRSAASSREPAAAVIGGASDRSWTYFKRGLLIQMTNAKAALIWIAIMSLAMHGDAPTWVGLSVVAGTGVISLAGHVLYAALFSTSRVAAAYRRARRWIEGALGIYFSFASYKLATWRDQT